MRGTFQRSWTFNLVNLETFARQKSGGARLPVGTGVPVTLADHHAVDARLLAGTSLGFATFHTFTS